MDPINSCFHMNKLTEMPPAKELEFAYSLGLVIWSMGQIEYLAIEWARRIGGEASKDDAIRKSGFGGRQKVVLDCIESQPYSAEKKKYYRILWVRAKGFSRFRNVIAHNPVGTMRSNPAAGFGILDARDMLGAQKRNIRVWFAPKLYQVAEKMKCLVSLLDNCLTEL